jgi:predicted dehydrogenase
MIGNDRKIRWGILGCGKIAHKFANDLLLSETSELFACASRNIEKSKVFAEKYNAKMFFDNYEDLAKCAEIDVIYIATPNSYHLEHSILCLNNQKAVLCEKPLCLNTAQVEELINVAKVNNVFLMEAMWTSCLPNILSIQNTIQSGAIGEIIHLTADFGFKTDYNPKSRLFDAALGGGSLLDIGIYPLYISLLFLGKPIKIQSSIRYAPTGVDASCTVLLTFEEGKTATLFSSFETITDIKCEIYGTKGKILIPNRFHEQNKHTIEIYGETNKNVSNTQVGYGYFYEIEHVNECLYQGLKESPIMPLSFSLHLINIMDEIRRQSKNKSLPL